jgi:hypothetical protein
MKLIEKLKWLWDPRTDKQKAYAEWDRSAPLMRRTQQIEVHIIDLFGPLTTSYSVEDWESGFGNERWASNEELFDYFVQEWINKCMKTGFQFEGVRYAPATIDRIVLGDKTLEEI